MLRRAFSLLMCAFTMAGCAQGYNGRYGGGSQSGPAGQVPLGLANGSSAASAQRVAILIPLTGAHADIGQVLQQAALLALPPGAGPSLDVIDTGGTAAGASTAAQTAVTNHDVVILGPLTSAETAAVAPVAKSAGIPVLAFTNDASQGQPGVWTIGITADQQVRRLVAAAQGQGKTQVAALLPDTDFGHAMANALTKAIADDGLPAPNVRLHGAGMASITSAARDVSGYAARRGPVDARIRAARADNSPEGRKEAQELSRSSIPPPNFSVLLLADTGDALQEIAAVLPYYDVDRSAVQVIGPALWSLPSSGSGVVSGAWYAAPDDNARANLERDYAAKYGVPPPPLADLAFDAASVAKVITASQRVDVGLLTQPAGFTGSDGWLAFAPDGQVRRGLAVFRVERSGPTIVEPAPQSAGAPGA